jgi:hypothetical protein
MNTRIFSNIVIYVEVPVPDEGLSDDGVIGCRRDIHVILALVR